MNIPGTWWILSEGRAEKLGLRGTQVNDDGGLDSNGG